MKKLIIILFIVGLIMIGYAYDQFGWCKRLLSNEPTTHTIQKGEYLSEIAQKYYGRADYWRELALVNRAPDSDAVFPGEEILIPSLDVIKKIRRTRWLSRVNGYLHGQEDILSYLKPQPDQSVAAVEPEPTPDPEPMVSVSETEQLPVEDDNVTESNEPAKSSSFYVILFIIGILFIGALVAFKLYRKKKEEEITIVKDINLIGDEEETESNYQEYLRNKDTEPDYDEYLRKKRERSKEEILN